MTQTAIASISPFFIVRHVPAALAFYCERLGFEIVHQEPELEPFFAIVQRDGAMIFVKQAGVEALPNCKRDSDARWDAYASVPDPDALAAEFTSRGVAFSETSSRYSRRSAGFRTGRS
ncbi:MAG TPA: VOC family protein [Candidatus Angelobacter sp.]|jgi:catechol 2,3-dioxygenase-like lactoylglutathione lyase family enzyme